jgi:enoyl-CoA hydratase/carnithine racemase
VSLVQYRTEGPVALITLDRPPVNALSRDLISDLEAAVAGAEDASVRAVVITGAPHFAAGADITGFQAAIDAGAEDALASELGAVVRRFERLEKPTIAAVRGYALGGGLELAMGADFRYLAPSARVGQPEIKLGIIPGAGGTQRLARLVGYQRALRLNLGGEHITAEEALEMGLADLVIPEDALEERAMTDAAGWAEGPTRAYAAVKRAMLEGFGRPIDDGLAAEARAFRGVFTTEDAREGIAAFLEKRSAAFRGV